MRKLFTILCFCVCFVARGQTWSYSYWFDANVDQLHTGTSTGNTLEMEIPTDGLSDWFHTLHIQMTDATGNNSPVLTRTFAIVPTSTADRTPAKYRYWFDDDEANMQTGTMTGNTFAIDMPVSTLSDWFHLMHYQVQDVSGQWSPVLTRTFAIIPKETSASRDLIGQPYRYWFDDDETTMQTGTLTSNTLELDAVTEQLPSGIHYFHLQVRDDQGNWSPVLSRVFKVGIEDILPWGTEEPWESKYIPNGSRDNYTEPATDVNGKGWTELSFDDSAWQTLTGPIANNTDIIEPVNFNWSDDVGGLNLRRTFSMESVPNGKYQLLMKHDDAVKVYLNNQLVVESYDCGTDFVYDIPSTALQVGENIIAIYIDQFGGNNYLDYCLQYLSQQAEPEPYAVLSDNDTKLTFYYDENKTEHNGMSVEVFELPQDRGWESVAHNITTVEFDTSIANDTTITSTAYWFYGCQELTSIIGMENLKTQSVTDMKYMFYNCNELEHVDVSGFNTANVTDMSGMFYKCHRLQELDLSNFNTFKVKNMSWMFYGCYDITRIYAGSYWTTTSVTESEEMFMNCTHLVGGHGTTYDENRIDYTFAHIDGGALNPGYFTDKNATIVTNPEPYAVLSEDNTVLTFYYDDQKEARNGMSVGPFGSPNARGWHNDTESITTVVFDDSFDNDTVLTSMYCWFYNCSNLTKIEGISNLHTAMVTDMTGLFSGCTKLASLDLTGFNTANVTIMYGMFQQCYSLNTIDVTNFNTAKVEDMRYMFSECSGLTTLDLSSFNVSNVTYMDELFAYCSALTTIYVGSEWLIDSEKTSGPHMFRNCQKLVGGKGTTYDSNHLHVDYAHIDGGPDNPGYFTDKNATIVTNPEPYAVLTEVNSNPNEGTITPNSTRAETATTSNYTLTFYYDEHKEERGGISVERGWANAAENITTVVFDESFANYTELTSTADWFGGCSNLTSIVGISNLKTDNVTDMSYMFRGCSGLESLDVSEFKTDKVMNMQGMFYGCYGLASLDLSNFNTANVTDVGEMFCYSSGLMSLNVSGFNTANMTNMGGMFKFCSGLTSLDVSSFNTVNVTSMKDMFYGCSGLTSLDVSSFNTNNVTVMEEMFSDCSSLTTIYVGEGWSTEKVTNGKDVFFGCTDLVGGKGTVFDPDHTDASYAHIDGGVNNPGYFTQIGGEIMATYENYVLTVEGDLSMAQALEQVGGRDVVAKDIAAIVWNSTEAITRSDIEGFGNPNLLIYVQADSLAPEGVNNVVIDGKAKNIVLVDADGNNNFYAPQKFTAESISYTREFKQTTQKDVSRGWEGICLPFTVQTYTHESHGAIAPFRNNASDYHFWLRQMTDKGLTTAENIEANMPYIISMPNSDAYPEAYNQAGKVTFAAENAKISKSTAVGIQLADRPIIVSGTYHSIATGYYALNVGHEYEGNPEGSIFILNYREIRPFEIFTWHNGSGARSISISSLFGGEGTTGIIDVIAEPNSDRWYDMNGRRLQSKPVRKGVYIKNGKKIVVK